MNKQEIYQYLKEKNILVLPPDVNKSKVFFSVQGDGY